MRAMTLGCLALLLSVPASAQIPLANVPAARESRSARLERERTLALARLRKMQDTVRVARVGDSTLISSGGVTIKGATQDTVVLNPAARALLLASLPGEEMLVGVGEEVEPDVEPQPEEVRFWPGANVAYNFASRGEGADKLSVSAQAALNLWNPGWNPRGFAFRVPIIGNVAKPTTGDETTETLKANAQEIITSSEGIYAGFAPYFERSIGADGYGVRFFGTAAIRTNSMKDIDADTSFNITHGRFSLGAMFRIGHFQTGAGQLNIETALARFDKEDYERAFGSAKRDIRSTDVVLILPIADKVGILAQYVVNHTTKDNVWRAGVALKPGS